MLGSPLVAGIAVKLLGGFEVTLARGTAARVPTKKAQALLAYLAMPAGRSASRETLAALLWPGTDEPAARNNLRQALFVLRKALGAAAGTLAVDATAVTLTAGVSVDVADFEREIVQKDPEALAAAIARYTGDFLSGLTIDEPPYEEWLVGHRERLRGLMRDGLARLVAHDARTGNLTRALETARRGLALDPLDEATHREVMRLHAATGHPVAALRQYQVCLDALQRELGVEPDAETRALYRQLVEQRRAGGREESPPTLGSDIPLVGRDAELARLREGFDAAALGHGRVVAILGEAGVGKSRLARELAAEVERREGRVLLGACHDAEQTLPLHPWVEALRRGGGLRQVDISAWPAGWRRELLRQFPELGPGEPHEPPGDESALHLFEALARAVTSSAAVRPLLLLVEDLHWADTMTLRFLAFLAHRIERAPVLVVVTAREEEAVDVPLLTRVLGELERGTRLTRLTLAPLTRAATDRLVRAHARLALADAALAPLRQAVWAASGGNAFVAVEMVHELRHGPTETGTPLPRKVHDLIADRLDRLSERAQELAAVAAVITGDLDFTLLARASGLGESESADGLEELVRRRILHGVRDRFAFVHDRIRDVAWHRLLPVRRRMLHRRVAEAAEALYAGELDAHAGTLAHHYRAAELWDRALPHLRRAGQRALATGAQREAATTFEHAVDALERLPVTPERLADAVDLRVDLRHALIPLGDFDAIARHLDVAAQLAARLGDRARVGRVLAMRANCHFNRAEYTEGRAAGDQAAAIARELGDRALTATIAMFQGMLAHQTGDWTTGAAIYRGFLDAANEGVVRERVGASGLTLIYARAYLCICLAELGQFDEAYAIAEDAVRLADGLRHPWGLAHASVAMSAVATRQGRPERALACYAWYRDALPPTGDRWPLADGWAAYAEVLSGRAADALPRLDPTGMPPLLEPIFQLFRGAACLELGRLREARALATQAMATGRRRGEVGYEAWSLHALAEIAARTAARGGEAERYYREALAIACARAMRPLEAMCRLGLAQLQARGGRRPGPSEALDAATAMLSELGMTRWIARAAASRR
ncbi:MAG: AAA family ATPase [Candidatus Rokubacteria bacterium]|nr:AAA family ATPase [Candidatus Rokubacteria bacterium]